MTLVKLYVKEACGRALPSSLQEVTWERWLQQAEGMVMLPGTERGAYDITWQQQQEALHACKVERSIHRVTVKKQHMFRVCSMLLPSKFHPQPMCYAQYTSALQHTGNCVLLCHTASSCSSAFVSGLPDRLMYCPCG